MKEFQEFNSPEDMDAASRYLIHRAKEATQHAYAPYSKFMVGAALMTDDETIVSGANVENASYPLCMCAERVALYAFASQHTGKKITMIAVVAHKRNHKELVSACSCGACRQVMLEFEQRQDSPIQVIMLGPGGKWVKSESVAALVPFGFDRSVLEV